MASPPFRFDQNSRRFQGFRVRQLATTRGARPAGSSRRRLWRRPRQPGPEATRRGQPRTDISPLKIPVVSSLGAPGTRARAAGFGSVSSGSESATVPSPARRGARLRTARHLRVNRMTRKRPEQLRVMRFPQSTAHSTLRPRCPLLGPGPSPSTPRVARSDVRGTTPRRAARSVGVLIADARGAPRRANVCACTYLSQAGGCLHTERARTGETPASGASESAEPGSDGGCAAVAAQTRTPSPAQATACGWKASSARAWARRAGPQSPQRVLRPLRRCRPRPRPL